MKNEQIRIGLLFLLHFFGIVACVVPAFKPLFQIGTPYHLIIISIIMWYDAKVWSKTMVTALLLSFVVGIVAEAIGVNTGYLFGDYNYTEKLGFKIIGVPLLIGVTWAGMAYASNDIFYKLKAHAVVRAVLAASTMVLFDVVLEQFAILIPLWKWHSDDIPLLNYISWFGVGLLLSLYFQFNKDRIPANKTARFYLITQLLFFIVYLYWFKP